MYTFKTNSVINSAFKMLLRKIHKRIEGDYKLVEEIKIDGSDLVLYGGKYFKFQDDGVRGVKGGASKKGYHYRDKKPPASAFKRYTSNKSHQFAIATKIYNKGFKAKNLVQKIEDDEEIRNVTELIYREYVDGTIYDQIKPR